MARQGMIGSLISISLFTAPQAWSPAAVVAPRTAAPAAPRQTAPPARPTAARQGAPAEAQPAIPPAPEASGRRALRRTPIVEVVERTRDAVVNIQATQTVERSVRFSP